jgi:hypothetical protein
MNKNTIVLVFHSFPHRAHLVLLGSPVTYSPLLDGSGSRDGGASLGGEGTREGLYHGKEKKTRLNGLWTCNSNNRKRAFTLRATD